MCPILTQVQPPQKKLNHRCLYNTSHLTWVNSESVNDFTSQQNMKEYLPCWNQQDEISSQFLLFPSWMHKRVTVFKYKIFLWGTGFIGDIAYHTLDINIFNKIWKNHIFSCWFNFEWYIGLYISTFFVTYLKVSLPAWLLSACMELFSKVFKFLQSSSQGNRRQKILQIHSIFESNFFPMGDENCHFSTIPLLCTHMIHHYFITSWTGNKHTLLEKYERDPNYQFL